MNKDTNPVKTVAAAARALMSAGFNPKTGQSPCSCSCGYVCWRKCGFDLDACMEMHYRAKGCGHKWDGPVVYMAHGGSVTCSTCGLSAYEHALAVGP